MSDCSFVIRYTAIATTKAHIQGSGRARHKDAVVFYFENNPVQEQLKAHSLSKIARDESLSLSTQDLKKAISAISNPITSRHPYPNKLVAGVCNNGIVNVYNCKQVFNQYCSIVLGASVRPKKDLYRYANRPGDQKILSEVRYPTPVGWQSKSSANYRTFWEGIDMGEVFSSAERVKKKSSSDKEEMTFIHMIVVELRELNLLDEHNNPDQSKSFETKRNCPMNQRWPEAVIIKNAVFQTYTKGL